MPRLPPCSSDQIIRALERDGFYQRGVSHRGSHRRFHKELPDGKTLVVVVVLGKREVPRGTLRSILHQAEMSEDRFLELLRS